MVPKHKWLPVCDGLPTWHTWEDGTSLGIVSIELVHNNLHLCISTEQPDSELVVSEPGLKPQQFNEKIKKQQQQSEGWRKEWRNAVNS